MSHGSVSPNSHVFDAPVGSPSTPARRDSRCPVRDEMRLTTSRRAASPSRRMALGDSRHCPSAPRSKKPCRCSSFSSSARVRASAAASGPRCRASASRSMSSRDAPAYCCDSCSASWSSSDSSCSAEVASPRPMPCSPRTCSEPVQSSPGRAARRWPSRRSSRLIRSEDPNACCASASSSSRCSGVSELRSRCAAAARCARESSSSSTFCGFSGKNSPCSAMNCSKSSSVSSPRECLSSSSLRSLSISEMRCRSSSVAPSSACFIPAKRWSSISRPSRSRIFS